MRYFYTLLATLLVTSVGSSQVAFASEQYQVAPSLQDRISLYNLQEQRDPNDYPPLSGDMGQPIEQQNRINDPNTLDKPVFKIQDGLAITDPAGLPSL